ncbi:hypothetical protein PoB_000752200 [Plakobranchus ocellatus]|uniref:Uncharacterized protein n=1 Tax=Plakobranchus ocellatus TaxID=259542 RepID=A0AAV3YDR0_9GAST|nr:hypothetical protein PoB_000752200 [Plakobranchus ocellatus]
MAASNLEKVLFTLDTRKFATIESQREDKGGTLELSTSPFLPPHRNRLWPALRRLPLLANHAAAKIKHGTCHSQFVLVVELRAAVSLFQIFRGTYGE